MFSDLQALRVLSCESPQDKLPSPQTQHKPSPYGNLAHSPEITQLGPQSAILHT